MVNLHPQFRQPFLEWCNWIEHLLQVGHTFYELASASGSFVLLPVFLHDMTPDESVVSTIDVAHSVTFLVACAAHQ